MRSSGPHLGDRREPVTEILPARALPRRASGETRRIWCPIVELVGAALDRAGDHRRAEAGLRAIDQVPIVVPPR